MRNFYKYTVILVGICLAFQTQGQPPDRSLLNSYVERFNQSDEELYVQHIPDSQALDFLARNIPRFECPDKELEEIYYFRWWTYRKHIKQTPEGFIITEFLPDVSWAGKYNGICCPAWFHFREGRWLYDRKYLNDYAKYWLKGGGSLRTYSFPVAHALYQYYLVTGDDSLLLNFYSELVENFAGWEKEKFDEEKGLFWQVDTRDGMEVSIGGSGHRATINSYMAAEAQILALVAQWKGDRLQEEEFLRKAKMICERMFEVLWDEPSEFLKVLPQGKDASLCSARELHGYTPWSFSLAGEEYVSAWKFLMDEKHFFAPFGPTTAEQCHPGFRVVYEGHECQWNGPSWPFATSMTLTGLANLLNEQEQSYVKQEDFFRLLKIYAHSQHLKQEDGSVIPWIDENLNPFTGDWISRTMLKDRMPKERGRNYNHSSFCDLVINGLIGIRPQADGSLIINPLTPTTWNYFSLCNVSYHGKKIDIFYDRTGDHYQKGKGFLIFANGKKIASFDTFQKVDLSLNY